MGFIITHGKQGKVDFLREYTLDKIWPTILGKRMFHIHGNILLRQGGSRMGGRAKTFWKWERRT